MNDHWMDRLSEYLDGELPAAEREALDAHLSGCTDCRATLEELRLVAARARSLDDRPPASDLWGGIAARIGASAAVRPIASSPSVRRALLRRAFTLSVPQLAAAALALIVVSGALVAGWMRGGARTATPLAPVSTRPPGTEVAFAGTLGGAPYDSAVAELERALRTGRGRLDAATVRVIEENLAIIDRAIDQARRALAADPGSVYLNSHLGDTLKRKVELLRRATALAAAQT